MYFHIDEQSNSKLLFYVITPMSFTVFILSILIVILLTKSNRKQKQFYRNHQVQTEYSLSASSNNWYKYRNNILCKTNKKKSLTERKSPSSLFPIKSEPSVHPIPYPIYLTPSSSSLPPLVLPSSSPTSSTIPPINSQCLSARCLYRSYV